MMPKKAPPAYISFVIEQKEMNPEFADLTVARVAKECGKLWRELPDAERQVRACIIIMMMMRIIFTIPIMMSSPTICSEIPNRFARSH